MDKAIVERALSALAGIGAARPPRAQVPQETQEPVSLSPDDPVIVEIVPATAAPCGSPHCAGCYDIGEGRKIHPPKIGESWRST